MMKHKRRFNVFRPGRIRQQILPVLVWLAAVAGVTLLFYQGSQRFEVAGIAQGEVSQVCAPVDGRLKAVYVSLFENVTKGEVVAALDDELIKAKIATVAATAEHLRAQVLPTQQQLLADIARSELNRSEEQRRFAIDVESSRLDILGFKAQIAADRITLESRAADLKISQELLGKNVIAQFEFDKTKALYDSLAKKVEETEAQLAKAEEQLLAVQKRADTFAAEKVEHPSVDAALEAVRKEIVVQERLMDELSVQQKDYVMTAPIDGVVIQILTRANETATRRPGEGTTHKPGEEVQAGQPILVIAQGKPKEIMAYAGERQINQIKVGARIELVKKISKPQIAQSEITYVGPVVEQLPARIWMNPNVPQYGLPFLVRVPDAMELTSGEIVGIRGL
jgi:multidrug resistance efflux pump